MSLASLFRIALCFAFLTLASAQRCKGRGQCPPGEECLRRKRCVRPLYTPPAVPDFKFISEIQGSATVSSLEGQNVTTIGIITAINSLNSPSSIWIQDIYEDDNPLTSEGLFIFRPNFSEGPTPAVGDVVQVSGTVLEFVSSSRPEDLPVTEISGGTAVVLQPGAAIHVQPVFFNPRAPLTSIGDGSGYDQNPTSPRTSLVAVNYQCSFPRESAICYYEAHEHMYIRVRNPRTVTPELNFGEIGVRTAPASCKSNCTLSSVVRNNSFRAGVITIEDDLLDRGTRNLGAGQYLKPFNGVIYYSFSQYKVYNTQPLRLLSGTPERLMPEPCRAAPLSRPGLLRISSWNLLNRDPEDSKVKLNSIATIIANFQRCPDIIGLSEIGDNDGTTISGETSADQTLQGIANATSVACDGAPYTFTNIDPIGLSGGGLLGENIRVAFLFRTDKVQLTGGVPKGGPRDEVMFDADSGGLTFNPGHITPSAFEDSRKPLAAEFQFVNAPNRQSFIVIVNHWNSKGEDTRLFQRIQPPLQISQIERNAQATAVKNFTDSVPKSKPLIVVGDLNDFYFSDPVTSLGLKNLWFSLPTNERYSFVFQSRYQALDHILVRRSSVDCGKLCAPHTSTLSSFGSSLRPTDHDPVVAVCRLVR